MFAKRKFFRYSAYDILPALSGVAIVALILWTFLAYSSLSIWVLAPAFFAVMWSYCWNLQCISHNFIHNPYFSSPFLNRALTSYRESTSRGDAKPVQSFKGAA